MQPGDEGYFDRRHIFLPRRLLQFVEHFPRLAFLARNGIDVTEAGHYIIDLWFPRIDAPGELETELEKTPGVVCTGLFVGRADLVIVGTRQGVVTLERPRLQP